MTAQEVKRRLREAAQTFRAWNANQPKVGPSGFKSSWPAIVRSSAEEFANAVARGYDPVQVKPAVPSPRAISEMDEILDHLGRLPKDDQDMLWMWANCSQMWRIAQRFRKSERTIHNWLGRACNVLAGLLSEEAA
jgi:hypothetical protein